ncbi:hypothetical protein EJ419_07315 [Alloscardovia theropitheci]|uniref:Phage head-tail adapter protein n=1 Tax=Alloscardovia theropitheci TaxID=2496842 RepID=A0A4R0QUQ2_9BIFI|nr:hypothetical protein [Alloscardovia theropitheci]TCD53767.1 hypothetical protein EJ419_07315 [Alloscardovia theropitheci]
MRGETVTVIYKRESTVDPFGASVYEQVFESVPNVLVAPGAQSNSTENTHPDGITVAYTLYFPRAWKFKSLRGCLIRIDDNEYTVIGDPRPYNAGLTPTAWNLVVQVADKEG